MRLLQRTAAIRLLRPFGAVALAAAVLFGNVGLAFADDDDDSNEVETYGPNVCTDIAGIPVYQQATCVKHERELENGVTETENTYVAQASADAVRLFFENTFQQNGWTLVKTKTNLQAGTWKYTVLRDGRRVKVKVVPQPGAGASSIFTIEEN